MASSFLLKNSSISFILFSCLVLMSFYSSSSAQDSGIATFYTSPYTPSACYGYEDEGVMIAAASEAIWNGGAACGKHYEVSCVSGTNASPHPCRGNRAAVVVKIVDLCPSPACRGTIDLSQEAFASIADPVAGVINISFHEV